MDRILTLKTVVNGQEVNFPIGASDDEAKIFEFTFDSTRMGAAPEIKAEFMWPSCLDNDWTDDVFVNFCGEKYSLYRRPTSEKDNNDVRWKHSITFRNDRVILSGIYTYDAVAGDNSPASGNTKIHFAGNLNGYVVKLNASLAISGLQNRFIVMVDDGITTEDKSISFEDKYFTEALTEGVETFGIPYYMCAGTGANINKIEVHFGHYKVGSVIGTAQTPLTYRTAGLTMTKREHSGNDVINRATGYGSGDNLPWYYPNASASGNHTLGGDLYVAGHTAVNYDALSEALPDFAHSNETLRWYRGYPYKSKPAFSEVFYRGSFYKRGEAQQNIFYEHLIGAQASYANNNGSIVNKSFRARDIDYCIINSGSSVLWGGTVNSSGVATFSLEAKNYCSIFVNSHALDTDGGYGTQDYWGYVRFANVGFQATAKMTFGGLFLNANDYLISDGNSWYVLAYQDVVWQDEGLGWYKPTYYQLLDTAYHDMYETTGFFFYLEAGQTINMEPSLLCEINSQTINPDANVGYSRVVAIPDVAGTEAAILAGGLSYLANRGYNDAAGFDSDLFYKANNSKLIKSLTELSGAAAGTEMTPVSGRYSYTAPSTGLYLFEFRRRYDISSAMNTYPASFALNLNRDIYFDVDEPHYRRDGENNDFFYESHGWVTVSPNVTKFDGATLTISATSWEDWMTPQPNLMPSIYRNSRALRRFYDAKNYPFTPPTGYVLDTEAGEYIDFQDGKVHNELYENSSGVPYLFGFLYDKNHPNKTVEHIGRYDDIKASIKGMTSDAYNPPIPIDKFLAILYDEKDSNRFKDASEGNSSEMEHPFFYVKLPKMPFNLFDSIGTDAATVSMTSGMCASCKFQIAVQENTNKNDLQVDDNGDLIFENGVAKHGTPQNRQNNTIDYECWICLKKDIETYGSSNPMPYAPRDTEHETDAMRPSTNDTFVYTGIWMPFEYILQAEERLSKQIVSDIYDNNFHKFNIGVDFSRIYLRENENNVLAKLCDSAKIWVQHSSDEAAVELYVSTFRYSMTKDALPEITVELAESLIPNQSSIQILENRVTQNVLNMTEDNDKPITQAQLSSSPEEPVALITSKAKSALQRAEIQQNLGINPKGSHLKPIYIDENRNFQVIDGLEVSEDIHTEKMVKADQGMQFGEKFESGLFGSGGKVDGNGHAEMRSMKLWEWLEVPEYRYNRVSIYTGIRWDTFGGGIIETITPDTTGLETGTGKLKLEAGEVGAIAVGDLCMGIWHDTFGNESVTSDDHKGNFTFAGFRTVYFQITAVSGSNNENFSYILRSAVQGGNGVHPFAGMHFAGRGNISNTARQAFLYTTTEYSLALAQVSTWEFGSLNIIQIQGKLDGFAMYARNKQGQIYLKQFSGYGQVFGNAYIFGSLDQFERVGYRATVDQSKGGSLAPGESELVTVTVWNGYGENVTDQFTHYSVTRDTGDQASDAAWNALHTSVSNPFSISFNDLGIDGIHKLLAVFNVLASDTENGLDADIAQVDYFS